MSDPKLDQILDRLDLLVAKLIGKPELDEPSKPDTQLISVSSPGTWANGVRLGATVGVQILNTTNNRNRFAVGAAVKLADGEERSVIGHQNAGGYMNLLLSGSQIDPAVCGWPNGVTLVADAPDGFEPEQPVSEPVPEPVKTSSWPHKIGINIACAEFTGENLERLNTDYRYAERRDFEAHINEGVKLFRVPYHSRRLFNLADRTFNMRDLELYEAAFAACNELGASIIPDPHDYGTVDGRSKSAKVTAAQLIETQLPLIDRWKHNPSFQAWSIQNEPINWGGEWLGGVCQEVIREINRQHSGLDILVPGESYQSAVRWMKSNKVPFPEGDNLIIDCHAYPDRDASGQWKLANGADDRMRQIEKDAIIKMVNPLWQECKKRGLRMAVTEAGIPMGVKRDEAGNAIGTLRNEHALAAMDEFLGWAVDQGIIVTVWAGGPSWGKHSTNAVEFKAGRGGYFHDNYAPVKKWASR